MASLKILLLYLQSVLYFTATRGCLGPSGKNVNTTYQYYYATEMRSVNERRSRRTCTTTRTGWFGWGRRRVCRTVFFYEWVDKPKSVIKSRPVYSCKTGWKVKGCECSIPICTGGCQNGGVCANPNICQCALGWTGPNCRGDFNECTTNQNKCGHKPGCKNTLGSYICTCLAGYHLGLDQRDCTDINECSTGVHDCGSNTKCVNTFGSYRCPCIDGFMFNASANSCQDIDECDPSSGVLHGCEMKCNNFVGGYNCSCDNGFILTSNERGCSDHKECAGNTHDCQQACLNVPGGYNCTCFNGYRLNTKDYKTCDDIDECSERISGCAQSCQNTIGSFACSCGQGYLRAKDLKSCNDIDECSELVDHCHHECLNTPGSYRCRCRQGFDLLLDGKTCLGRPCIPTNNPVNGMKNCSGYRTEDRCNFYCLPGYDLHGSSNRTCSPNKQWTGNNTECKIIHCAYLEDPSNGFIYSPCATHYGSQCSAGCNYGYYTETITLTCDANRIWQQNNVLCKEIKVCQPNPCLHGGVCSIVSSDHYTCDCTNTGYKGTNCDVGFFTISEYPTLAYNVLSLPITIHVSPPNDYVVLNIASRGLEFIPSRLVFKRDSSLNQSIRVRPQGTGFYFIGYSLSGANAREFYLPKEDVLFVNIPNNSTKFEKENPISNFPIGCYNAQLQTCPRTNEAITALSTSPFVSFGPVTVTQGVVAINVGNTSNIPLSLLGINLPNSNLISPLEYCDDRDVVSYSTELLLKSRMLAKSFLDTVAGSFPTWIKVTLSKQNLVKNTYSSELKTQFLSGNEFRGVDVGEGQPVVDDMFYSKITTWNINVTIQNDVDVFNSNALSLAVELCGVSPSNIFLRPALKDLNAVNNVSILKKLKEYGWDFKFYSLQFSKANTITRLNKDLLWDGFNFFKVKRSSDGSFAAVSSLKKDFRDLHFADIRLKFEGTIIGKVKDMDKILDSPLDQNWDVDLYGSIILTVGFQVEGQSENLSIHGRESVGYASFGGNPEKILHEQKRGFFFTSVMRKDSFSNSALRNFVEISSERNLSCFLNTKLYKQKHHSHHTEMTDRFSCAFLGSLKFGPLRFHSLDVNLLMGKIFESSITANSSIKSFEHSIELLGSNTPIKSTTFGIFKLNPNIPMNVRFSIGQNTSNSTGSFSAVCTIFGIEKLVNVSISYEGLKFKVNGKMYGMYDASMTCSSSLLSWNSQFFDVEGQFETNPKGNYLVSLLKKELNTFTVNVILQAFKRLEAANQTVERARSRLEKVVLINREAAMKHKKIASGYSFAKNNFESVQKKLIFLEYEANNYSKDVKKLESDLSSLCQVKECPDVCQEGISCTTCYHDIIGNTMGLCPATCFTTKQQRIPPNSEVAFCEKEKCKRIHSTYGFFKSFFGKTLGGLIKNVLSLGITAVATVLRAPPPLSAALGNGIITFLDTGRPDQVLCSAAKGFFTGGVKDIGLVAGKLLSCEREQRDGSWNCRIVQVKCIKGRFEYEYKNTPYLCKQSCLVETVTKTVEKSCCRNVSCASFAVNVTCVAENVLCKKVRMDVLENISETKSKAGEMLQKLEETRRNASYWKIKKQKKYNNLISARRWLNTTEAAVRTIEKAYNNTIESRNEIKNILSKPLRMKFLLNEKLTSVEGIILKEIHFKGKVFARTKNFLLPIDITFQANGTLRVLSTILDFANLNISLKSIAREILSNIFEVTQRTSRKKRSLDINTIESDNLLSSLKKYHSYCAKFTNYHKKLYNVASSLHNLSSEVLLLHKTLSQRYDLSLDMSNVKLAVNETIASKFGLNESQYNSTSAEYLKDDLELIEAIELQQEAIQQRYESLNSTTKLLLYNWYAAMEEMFNSSTLAYECTGMKDCIAHILDELIEMFAVIEADGVDHIQKQIKYLERALDDLSNPVYITIDEASEISSGILNILKEMTKVKVVCAQSPNITKHPNSSNELAVGKDLELYCNATGTALVYSWTFNGEVLQDQKSNVLKINNITVSNNGNYTCEVSNHIAKERSTPANVMIHSPPVIVQPVKYLVVILADDDYLQCEVQEGGTNISYQWWFKSIKSSFFTPLDNETFSYLNFSPMKREHEGWYFCQVSNPYGVTSSRISFVKALSFTLPVPTAILSFSVTQRTTQINSSFASSNNTGFDEISSLILTLLLSYKTFSEGMFIKNLRPISCGLGRSKNNTKSNIEVCSWEFQLIGKNVTSNVTLYNDFEVNAGQVINATREVHEKIGKLVKTTNNGSLSFSMASDVLYVAERNSMAVQKFSFMCPTTQSLVQKDFKCVDCPPGYYAEIGKDQMVTCKPCQLGFYQQEPGKSTCKQCSMGFTTVGKGAYEHAQCKVICKTGHYGTVKENIGYCFPCPLNTFQPHEGQTKCLPCPSNHVTNKEGASDSKQCVFETTQLPGRSTQTTPTGRITQTTATNAATFSTQPTVISPSHDESSQDENKALTVGLSLGLLMFTFIVIGVAILIRRRKRIREHTVNSKTKKQQVAEEFDNPVYSGTSDFQDDALCVNKHENMAVDDLVDSKNVEAGDVTDAVKGKQTSSAFQNPLFEEMLNDENM